MKNKMIKYYALYKQERLGVPGEIVDIENDRGNPEAGKDWIKLGYFEIDKETAERHKKNIARKIGLEAMS